VWGNRIQNAAHNGISYQPQNGSPWYIIRNQLVGFMESPFKFRTTDRSVIVHNTIVMWGKLICCNEPDLLRSIVKNNLWVSVAGGQIWNFGSTATDWRSDLDYNGFDWGISTAPFKYGGIVYTSVAGFAAASGLEMHGRRIDRTSCFATLNVPGLAPITIPPQIMTLKAGCNAVDAGAILPNINDGFIGAAPDLGAFELGQAQPIFGPRPGGIAIRWLTLSDARDSRKCALILNKRIGGQEFHFVYETLLISLSPVMPAPSAAGRHP
jgi:hypothetical protein